MGKRDWVISRFSFVMVIIFVFALGVFVGRMSLAAFIPGDPELVSGATHEEGKTSDGTVIKTGSLSAEQQKFLSRIGINADAIIITPAMVACAEAKLGAARMAEIVGGAVPSFTEGVSLLACYKPSR